MNMKGGIVIVRNVELKDRGNTMKKKRIGFPIPYEVRHNVVCISPCMLMGYVNGMKPMIGSALCTKCTNFVEKDSNKHVVICRNKEGARIVGYSPPKKAGNGNYKSTKVVCMDTGESFISIKEASRHFDISTTSISNSCKRGLPTKKNGLIFKYYDGK